MPADPVDIGFQSDYILALHGTSRDSKLWPVANWIALGKSLAEKNIKLALPWGSDTELARANEIAAQLKNAKVLPKLGIAKLAPIIGQAKAAIGVDTGLTHLAAAFDVSTIAIYTDSNPALNGVIAGANAPALNLGNIGQIPSVDEVLQAFQHVTT